MIARAAESEGADALVCVNTLRGHGDRAVVGHARCSGRAPAGSAGPALKPVALAAVWTCAGACGLPIVGVGGVLRGRDALDLLDAGAVAVQVGTALFRDPRAVARIHDEMQGLVENRR